MKWGEHNRISSHTYKIQGRWNRKWGWRHSENLNFRAKGDIQCVNWRSNFKTLRVLRGCFCGLASKGMQETINDTYFMAGDFCHKAPSWPGLKRPDVERYKKLSCEILLCIMRKRGELTNLTLTLLLSVKCFVTWHSSAVSHTQGTKGRRPDVLGQLTVAHP